MSAPTTRDPLVVNTKDGVVWLRRAVTAEGRGLYAVTGSCSCPEFLMATLAELAEHGIAGSADVLPMPVGPQPHPSYDELTERQKTVAAPGTCGRALVTGKPCPDHPRQQPSEAPELEQLRVRVDEAERAYTFDTAALKRRIAELEAERHATNEALDDAVQALRARESESVDRSAVLDDFIARCEVALSGCCSECDAATAIVKGRKQAALDNAPVPEHLHLLSEGELRKSLRGHLFGGGS